MKDTLPKLSGAALALAAASLMSGCASTSGSNSQSVAKEEVSNSHTNSVENKRVEVDLVRCVGVNQCKGHNNCKTTHNSCRGHGSCKGRGFVVMPEKACQDVGGAVIAKAHQAVSKADLIHCSGVNACKGHNDCKTANNACAGHAKCEGQGYVLTTQTSCDNIGGT